MNIRDSFKAMKFWLADPHSVKLPPLILLVPPVAWLPLVAAAPKAVLLAPLAGTLCLAAHALIKDDIEVAIRDGRLQPPASYKKPQL